MQTVLVDYGCEIYYTDFAAHSIGVEGKYTTAMIPESSTVNLLQCAILCESG